MKRLLLFFAMLISLTLPFERLGGSFLQAQGNDPVLAGMILAYTNKAEKELEQQEQMMLLESTGHLWIKEEVQGVTDLQKEFNTYLDNFHSIISYAAQIYGFLHRQVIAHNRLQRIRTNYNESAVNQRIFYLSKIRLIAVGYSSPPYFSTVFLPRNKSRFSPDVTLTQ